MSILDYLGAAAACFAASVHKVNVVRDARLTRLPSDAIGHSVYGHTQMDHFSCGATAAFTAICARKYARTGTMPNLTMYHNVWGAVGPDPDNGSTWQDVNRVLHSRYCRFRAPEVRKRLREGKIVLASVAWPTEAEPDLQHFVVITATAGDRWLVTNTTCHPGRSQAWVDWAWLRESADDQCLEFAL